MIDYKVICFTTWGEVDTYDLQAENKEKAKEIVLKRELDCYYHVAIFETKGSINIVQDEIMKIEEERAIAEEEKIIAEEQKKRK